MSDAFAMQTFQSSPAWSAACPMLPRSLLLGLILRVGVCSDLFTRDARLEALAIAFAMFRRIYDRLDEIPSDSGIVISGDSEAVLTLANRQQLRRAMDVCVAYDMALRYLGGDIALARLSTHDVESHSGMTPSVLRGQSQWRFWISAEAFARMLPQLQDRIELARRARRSRAQRTGSLVPAVDTPEMWQGSGAVLADLRQSAIAFIDRTHGAEQFEACLADMVAAIAEEGPPSTPGAYAGVAAEGRPFRH
jgi:hypothetical protein